MATTIFLGEPPANIKQWIIDHATPPGPAGHTETRFTLEGGTVETHNITGTLDMQWMIDNGFYEGNDEEGQWVKIITSVDIGTTVIFGYFAFVNCTNLTTITIPDTVSFDDDPTVDATFCACNNITNVTITSNGGDANNVKQMMIYAINNTLISDNITWNMPS